MLSDKLAKLREENKKLKDTLTELSKYDEIGKLENENFSLKKKIKQKKEYLKYWSDRESEREKIMGEKQFCFLMYGPNVNYRLEDWIERFNLVDKREWVENFLTNETHNYETPYDSDDENLIDTVFTREFDKIKGFDLLSEFLEKNLMTFVFNNNYYFDEPYIGMDIKNYDLFSESDKKIVSDFCKCYDLPNPTFYAGLCKRYY